MDDAALRALLAGPAHEVAPRLLGATVRHGGVTLRLTEVEAYAGAQDAGSHAHRGPTRRNLVMFGPPGRLYCYFTYGMHVCCNVVTGAVDEPGAVLLRAGSVVAGLDVARARRPGATDRDLARGPARLCRALGITLAHNGTDLLDALPSLDGAGPSLGPAEADVDPGAVSSGPRVGLRGAPDVPWRFWLTGEATVSTYRPAAPPRAR